MGARTARRACDAIAALLSLTALPSLTRAVVVSDAAWPGPDAYPGRYVASWNGASAVAIAPHWLISAAHVGGGPGLEAVLGGEPFAADRVVRSRTEDILLIHVEKPLPGWHTLAAWSGGLERGGVVAGQRVMLGGMGYRAGSPLPGGGGVDWSGGPGEAWGANIADAVGLSRILITLDPPGSAGAVPGEAMFSLLDSGGGLFVDGPDGSLELAGIAVSITSVFGQSRWGDRGYVVNLDSIAGWIRVVIEPGHPAASSIPPPAEGAYVPPPPPTPAPATVALLAVAAPWRRGRRCRC
jgi:hypothetical protein